MAAKAEKKYMDKVAQLPCVLCGSQPVELHHVRSGQGISQRAQNWLVIPVCPECHRGNFGIHGDKTMLRIQKVDEIDLLAKTIELLNQV